MDIDLPRAAFEGTLNRVPKKYLTQKNLSAKGYEGNNIFHLAAWQGHLDQIPREFLTQENLAAKGCKGNTVFHVAAWQGHLDQIPREFLTQENLAEKNDMGYTVFHRAALRGNLDSIPHELLTPENLALRNHNGKTVLQTAVGVGNLYQIPPELFTPTTLSLKDSVGDSILENADEGLQLDAIPYHAILETIFKKPKALAHLRDLVKTSPGMIAMIGIHRLNETNTYEGLFAKQFSPADTLAIIQGRGKEPQRYAAVIRRLNPIAEKIGIRGTQRLGYILNQICTWRDGPDFRLGDLEIVLQQANKQPENYCKAADLICPSIKNLSETNTLWLLTQVAANLAKPPNEREPLLDWPDHVIDFFNAHGEEVNLNTGWRRIFTAIQQWDREMNNNNPLPAWFESNPESAWDEPFQHPNYKKAPKGFADNGVSYRLLRCPRDLLNEAQSMRHCVAASYLDRAFDGHSLLYHTESEGTPGTIEISPQGAVVQIQGVRNSTVPYESQVRETWDNIRAGFNFEPAVKRLYQGGEITDLERAQATWHSRSNASAAELLQTFEAKRNLPQEKVLETERSL